MRKNIGAKFVAFALALVVFFGAPSTVLSSPVVFPLDLVILVDESSSLANSDVKAEIRAVISLISRRELSREDGNTRVATRVTIAGFGSGSAAVDEKCEPTLITIENVQDLAVCAEKVRRRNSTGQHTDFARAFEYASTVFEATDLRDSARVVILLTDGKFDPDGKRVSSGLTAENIRTLNESTASLREKNAQIWPLGFGQVEEGELNELARSGAPTQCESGRNPYAIIADDETLDEYLLEILGATLCIDPEGPEDTPASIKVHPFVNEVVLTVRGVTEDAKVVVEETKKVLCVGKWKVADDGSRSCTVAVLGTDVGNWKITTSQPGTVENSQSGRVDLRLSECEDSSANVSVSRIDDTEIQWNLGSGLEFPRAVVVDTASRKEVGSIVLTSDNNQVTFSDSGSTPKELEVGLASGQGNFVWLTASRDSCAVVPSTPDTSQVLPTSVPPVTDAEDDGDSGSGGLPWLLIFLLLTLLILLGWYIRRRSRNSKFPSGAEFQQRNVAQNPAAKWNSRADLSGLREVFLSLDRNGWLIEASKEEAVLAVRKLASKGDGDFVVVQIPSGSGQEDAEQGAEATHVFNYQDDIGSGIAFKDTFIRVVVPEELDEENLEDDEEQ